MHFIFCDGSSVIFYEFKLTIYFYYYFVGIFHEQKTDSFLSPLIDQHAKEGKDKKVIFEARFSKPNAKPKWFCRKDVCIIKIEQEYEI